MRSHKFLLLLFVLSALLTSNQPAVAGSASGTLTVSATVVKSCILTTTPLAFGNYDPVDMHASSDLRARGNITVACAKDSTPSIAMGVGNNAPGIGTTRAMLSEGNKLSYEIYKDAGLTQVWTDRAGGLLSLGVVSSFQAQIISV